MNLAPAHGLGLLYRRTGTRRYLDLARQLVGEFAAVDANGKPMAGDYLRGGLAGTPFYKTPRPRLESLHPILALAELHRITGEARYRTAFENLWWSIVELDRHNNGGFSSGEQAQGNPYHRGAIETCCTIAWIAMSVDMLKMTGDSVVADELELSTLNSALGMFSPTGRWSTYNTPMDGDRKANFHEINFQCRPGSPELNCCSVNAARGVGLIGEWAVMRDPAGLYLNWYGAGSIAATLESGGSVTLVQETDYPRSGRVQIRVEPSRNSKFAAPPPYPALVGSDGGQGQRRARRGGGFGAVSELVARVEVKRQDRAIPRPLAPVLGRRARMRRVDIDLPRPDPDDLRSPLQCDRPGRPSVPGREGSRGQGGCMGQLDAADAGARVSGGGWTGPASLRFRQRRGRWLDLSLMAQGRACRCDALPPKQSPAEWSGRRVDRAAKATVLRRLSALRKKPASGSLGGARRRAHASADQIVTSLP